MLNNISKTNIELPLQSNKQKSVSITIFSTNISNDKPIMILLGIGEEYLVAKYLAKKLKKHSINAHLVYTKFRAKDTIEEISTKTPIYAAQHLNSILKRNRNDPFDTISHSQGSGMLFLACLKSELFAQRSHVLITPVGLNSPSFGDDINMRIKEFWFRLIKLNLKQPDVVKLKFWRNGFEFSKRLFSDFLRERKRFGDNLLNEKIIFAINQENHIKFLDGMKKLADTNKSCYIISGRNDPLFRNEEIADTLTQLRISNKVKLINMPGAHESLASTSGFEQLILACQLID